ncbi:hypothetical protein AKJ16_DCAP26236 [Drosera capensis]
MAYVEGVHWGLEVAQAIGMERIIIKSDFRQMEKSDAYRKGSGASKKWYGGGGPGGGNGPSGGGGGGPRGPRGLDNMLFRHADLVVAKVELLSSFLGECSLS